MSYEDSDSTVAALKIINRLLDKIQDLEKREHAERIEKMLVAQAAKPPVDELAAWRARWKVETQAQIKLLEGAPSGLVDGASPFQVRASLLGFLRSLEASL